MLYEAADIKYMHRALALARYGLGSTRSNPLVGAVIVAPDGAIVGEGWHRRYGEAHAEVNAVAQARKVLEQSERMHPGASLKLSDCTIYVTLEPCAHYGKTPPCALLLRDCGFRRAVVATADPFSKVDGRGFAMLRQSGMQVDVGLLGDEARQLNAPFFTAHTHARPFVTLKWAQSADGYMDNRPILPITNDTRTSKSTSLQAAQISTRLGSTLVHRLRSTHQAIMVGSGTALADSPRLDVRLWQGTNPERIIADRRGRFGDPTPDLSELLSGLYGRGITSLLVEGGPTLLNSFIATGLWDVARIESSPMAFGDTGSAPAPSFIGVPIRQFALGVNTINYYSNNPLVTPYFIENGM